MSDDRKCGCRGAYVSCDLCNPDEATTIRVDRDGWKDAAARWQGRAEAAEREVEKLKVALCAASEESDASAESYRKKCEEAQMWGQRYEGERLRRLAAERARDEAVAALRDTVKWMERWRVFWPGDQPAFDWDKHPNGLVDYWCSESDHDQDCIEMKAVFDRARAVLEGGK